MRPLHEKVDKQGKRWRWWLACVLACVLAGAVVIVMMAVASQNEEEASDLAPLTTTKQTSAAVTTTESIHTIPLERLKRAQMHVKKAEIFSAKSWYVPPPPPPPALPVAPPPPSAPPLPFTFLGQIQKPDGKLTIFLSGVNRVYLVSEGETIDNTYHVDGIEDGRLVLTYLPLQIKQYLDLGETS